MTAHLACMFVPTKIMGDQPNVNFATKLMTSKQANPSPNQMATAPIVAHSF
jgi:hypothetical protein